MKGLCVPIKIKQFIALLLLLILALFVQNISVLATSTIGSEFSEKKSDSMADTMYPDECFGGWKSSEMASGEPDSGDVYSTSTAALLENSSSVITCRISLRSDEGVPSHVTIMPHWKFEFEKEERYLEEVSEDVEEFQYSEVEDVETDESSSMSTKAVEQDEQAQSVDEIFESSDLNDSSSGHSQADPQSESEKDDGEITEDLSSVINIDSLLDNQNLEEVIIESDQIISDAIPMDVENSTTTDHGAESEVIQNASMIDGESGEADEESIASEVLIEEQTVIEEDIEVDNEEDFAPVTDESLNEDNNESEPFHENEVKEQEAETKVEENNQSEPEPEPEPEPELEVESEPVTEQELESDESVWRIIFGQKVHAEVSAVSLSSITTSTTLDMLIDAPIQIEHEKHNVQEQEEEQTQQDQSELITESLVTESVPESVPDVDSGPKEENHTSISESIDESAFPFFEMVILHDGSEYPVGVVYAHEWEGVSFDIDIETLVGKPITEFDIEIRSLLSLDTVERVFLDAIEVQVNETFDYVYTDEQIATIIDDIDVSDRFIENKHVGKYAVSLNTLLPESVIPSDETDVALLTALVIDAVEFNVDETDFPKPQIISSQFSKQVAAKTFVTDSIDSLFDEDAIEVIVANEETIQEELRTEEGNIRAEKVMNIFNQIKKGGVNQKFKNSIIGSLKKEVRSNDVAQSDNKVLPTTDKLNSIPKEVTNDMFLNPIYKNKKHEPLQRKEVKKDDGRKALKEQKKDSIFKKIFNTKIEYEREFENEEKQSFNMLFKNLIAHAEDGVDVNDPSQIDEVISVYMRDQLLGERHRLSRNEFKFKHGILKVFPDESRFKSGAYGVEIQNELTDADDFYVLKDFIYYIHSTHQNGTEFIQEITGDEIQLPQQEVSLESGINFVINASTKISIPETFLSSGDVKLRAQEVDMASLRDVDSQFIISAFEFGTPGIPMIFDTPVKVTIPVSEDEAEDEEYITIRVRHEGEITYDDKAISVNQDATCYADGTIADATKQVPIINEQITFYTCQTSTYLGQTSIDPAGSCFEAKQRDVSATDGIYWLQTSLMTSADEFYCDMTTDGGGWVLIGRGREGWAWSESGTGTAASIRNTPSGTGAFTPAYLSTTTVSQLLDGTEVRALDEGIRLRRAANSTGTEWQEYRWFLNTQTDWSWIFDNAGAGYALTNSVAQDSTFGTGGTFAGQTTRDNTTATGNDHDRVFTWAWASHNSQTGFAYGSSVTFGDNTATNFAWEFTTENHSIPFTQVYIRPFTTRGPSLDPEIGSPFLWLDAQDIDGDGSMNSAYVNGDPVNEWTDKGDNGFVFTRKNSTAVPTLNTTGFNSFPSITDDATTNGYDSPADFEHDVSNWTFIFVMDVAVGEFLFDMDANERFVLSSDSDTGPFNWNFSYYQDGFEGSNLNELGQMIMTYRFEDGGTNEVVIRRDGTQIQTDNNFNPQSMANNFALFDFYNTTAYPTLFDGEVAEIIIYDRALSDNELRNVERYLDFKWDVTGAVDDDYQLTVYRESGGGDTVPNAGSTLDMTWDTLVSENTEIARQAGNANFELTEGGHYLVMYSVDTEDLTTANGNRSELQSYLQINDSITLPYGYASSYIRRRNGAFEGYNSAAAIVNQPPGTDIKVVLERTDSNTNAAHETDLRPNSSGINILKLDDSWKYIQSSLTTDQTGFGSTTAWVDVALDNDDEIDSGYSRIGGAIMVPKAGKYIVTYNVGFGATTGSGTRGNDEARLYSDDLGSEIEMTRTAAYMKTNQSALNPVASWTGVIDVPSDGDVIRLQARREGNTQFTNHQIDADKTGITMVKIPNTIDFIQVGSDTSAQQMQNALADITWDDTIEEDTVSFDHDGTNTDRINLEQDGDYLFFHTLYGARTSGGQREEFYGRLELNDSGTPVQYGSSGGHLRGTGGTPAQTAFSTGAAAGLILPSLLSTDYVTLTQNNEASNGAGAYQADRIGLQGIYIPSLFIDGFELNQLHYRWRDDSVGINAGGGYLSAEDTAAATTTREELRRLRIEVANTGTGADADVRDFQLQWGDKTNKSSCDVVTEWAGIDDNDDDWELVDATNIINGTTTTIGILANAEAYTFVDGKAYDTTNGTSSIAALGSNEYTEMEFSIQPTEEAVTGHEYCFRLYDTNIDEELGVYTQYPTAIIIDNPAPLTALEELPISNPLVWLDATDYNGTGVNPADGASLSSLDWIDKSGNGNNFTSTIGAKTYVESGINNRGSVSVTGTGYDAPVGAQTPTDGEFSLFYVSRKLVSDSAGRILDGSTGNWTLGYHDNFRRSVNFNGTPNQQTSGSAVSDGGETSTHFHGMIRTTGGFLSWRDDAGPIASVGLSNSPANVGWDIGNGAQNGTQSSDFEIGEYIMFDRALDSAEIETLEEYLQCKWMDVCNAHFDQMDYRWYENTDAVTPVTALQNENTTHTGLEDGEQVRLRMSAQSGVQTVFAGSIDMKLQFTNKVGTCDVSTGWADVGNATSTTIWRGYDNAAVADGATTSSSLLHNASTTFESYEETNPTVTNPFILNTGDRPEWDFVLDNNGAVDNETYCFRLITTNDDEIYYTRYPEITTIKDGILFMTISDTQLDFGRMSITNTKYAATNTSGTTTESAGHTISIGTNAVNGYVLTVYGKTPTNGNGDSFNAIGGTAAAPVFGTEQFGIRLDTATGTGTSTAPYNTTDYAYDAVSNPDIVGTGPGDSATTTYDVYYMSNINALTPSGSYETDITYIVTGTF